MIHPLVRLGNCCQIVAGATPKTDVDAYWGGDIVWATPKDIANLEDPVLMDTPDKITTAGYKNCSTQMLPAGAILVSSRAPIGHVAIAGREMCTNQGFKSLVPGPRVDSSYLYHCMKYHAYRLAALGNGATFKEVSKSIVEDFEIPLPSDIDEQRRIAAILNKAEAIRKKRREATKLADDFLRSVFLSMFGHLFFESNEKWVKLGDCTDFIDYRGKTPEKADCGVRLITAKNVRDGVINFEPAEFISDEIYLWWMSRGYPRSGDVLFTTEAPLGNVAVLRTEHPVAIGQRLIAIRPHESLSEDYLSWALRQNVVQHDIFSRATGSTVKGIRSAELVQVKIPIPGKSDQLKFEKVVYTADHQKSAMHMFSQQDDLLFQSLQYRAFQGQL